MSAIEIALANLTSPPLLAFVLGLLVVAMKSDVKVPDPVYQAISIYLLLGIGIKGGVSISSTPIQELWLPALVTLALGLVIPVVAFALSGAFVRRLSLADRGALAAHYGSTSLVTFTAAMLFLEQTGQSVEGFMTTLLAILEVPGILVGLLLASRGGVGQSRDGWGEGVREILTGKSLVLLVGGLAIGALTGESGYARIEPVFGGLFTGVLTIFLLELGIIAGRRLGDVKTVGFGLVGFAVAMPLVSGTLGAAAGLLAGLSVAGAGVLGVMAASASYIAAPAAVRLALPTASPGIYLTASLGITFPFNLIVGIPLIFEIARLLAGLIGA